MSRPLLVLIGLLSGCSSPDATESRAPVDPRQTIVPAELADDAALARFSGLSSLAEPSATKRARQTSGQRPGGGPPTLTPVGTDNRDMNNFVCKSADAAVATEQVVPPVYDLPTCPEPYVRGVVLSRFEGAGELSRLWMTAFSLPHFSFDDEMLRVYVDDDPTPRVQVPLAAVVDGSAGEVFAPPFGLAAKDRVAWRYPVVFGKKLLVALDGLGPFDLYYHQTEVLLTDQPREPSRFRLPARDLAIERTSHSAPAPPLGPPATVTLAPGQTKGVADLDGPATIATVLVEPAADLTDVWLELVTDGKTTASLPLLDLFAASAQAPPGRTLPLGPGLELRLPIPFAASSVWSLENRGTSSTALTLTLFGAAGVPPGGFRTLHVEVNETKSAAARHPIATVQGAGRLAGVCLVLSGRADATSTDPFNFLEGDERFTLDGVRSDGTGTEDYLDSAFYFIGGAFASPFAAAWGISSQGPVGRVAGCRWHVQNDVVDFEHGLELELEVGAAAPTVLDRYRSVAYVYR
ncbi:MAG: DUF2961 domain-containing protein [Myxococcales bacterium]|nr:DUF2961 domain-containing protein [Myxococcales bacterium]